MALINIFNKFSNLSSNDFQRFVSAFLDQLYTQFNGKIDFVSNIRASGPTVVSFTSNSDVRGVSHTLGTIPAGFLDIKPTEGAVVFAANGVTYPWTNAKIYLQASTGFTATIYII